MRPTSHFHDGRLFARGHAARLGRSAWRPHTRVAARAVTGPSEAARQWPAFGRSHRFRSAIFAANASRPPQQREAEQRP
jgi:hypothetical protein